MLSFKVVPIREGVAQTVRRERRDEWGNADLQPTVADAKPGYPCRVCLEDAELGEPVLLFSHSPFAGPRPYRNVGPVFIHAKACRPYSPDGGVPRQLRTRLLALRSYDGADRMVAADVVEGREIEPAIERMFQERGAQYIHVHNAPVGCFFCRIERG